MSLRTRLLLGFFLIAVVLGFATYFVTSTTRHHLVDLVDRQLQDVTATRRERYGDRPFGTDGQPSTLYYAELFPDGEMLVRLLPNLDGDGDNLPALDLDGLSSKALGQPFSVKSEGDHERWRVMVTEGPDHLEITALSLGDVDEAVNRLILVEAMAGVGVVAALALVGWWVMRLGVRPIKQMTVIATDIAEGDLSHRVPDAHRGTEAAELGQALNQMLTTIQDSFAERAETEERLKQFVADASHELRTPIATIRGYAELYRRGGVAPGEELDDAMRRTEMEAIRMGGLVDDLLHLARLDQGRPLERHPVALDRLARDAANDARAVAPDREITTDVVDDVWVIGDEPRLRQVVANLVANARVHTPSSSAITVSVRREGAFAVFEVADQGPGMAPEVTARAFERFYRADRSRARQHGGSGLGLAIVKSTIEALGGTVSLRSSPHTGTVVRFELPVGAPPAVPAAGDPSGPLRRVQL